MLNWKIGSLGMRPTVVESCFEVAFWLLDRATDDGEYLQSQKMNRILYLAYAYYGILQRGGKLMPATFIVAEEGPIEPTVFKAFARGRSMVDTAPIDEAPRHVLDSVWRQFCAHSVDHLDKLLRGYAPYADAFAVGAGTEIVFEAMAEFYGAEGLTRRRSGIKSAQPDAPVAHRVLRPKVMRNHARKPVNVHPWMPKVWTEIIRRMRQRAIGWARALALLLALFFAVLPGVSAQGHRPYEPLDPAKAQSLPQTLLAIESNGSIHHFSVELADTPDEHAVGLMHRNYLPPDHGMLFDYKSPQWPRFWMRNTFVSLDMLFIRSNGEIAYIAEDAVPHSERTIGPRQPVQAVLEVPAGTVERLGLKIGDTVRHHIFGNVSSL